MAEPRLDPPRAPNTLQRSQFPPPSAPSNPQCSQFPTPSLGELMPPSHFVLRPRSLRAELDAEKGRVHELEAELKALRGRSQHLEAELEAERGRSQALGAELEAERGRGQALEAELEALRGRGKSLGAEPEEEKGPSQILEMAALRERGQSLEAELEAERGRSQMLEMELETLRGRGLGPEGAEPSPEQVLLDRWRQKVFQLLLQVRLHQGQELRLQGQVRSLGAAVAAGSRQVSQMELRLRRGEQEWQGERQALSQERLRAEAAEEELGKLGQALSRLLGTLGVALANVTAAVLALGTLSERLGRAQDRLRVLVASGRLRWQRQLEGTASDSGAVALEVTPEQATTGRDRTWPRPDTVSLAPLVTQLQALGAAILGYIGDPVVPPPPRGQQ